MTQETHDVEGEALRRKTVEERLRVAEMLRDFAWEVKRSALRRRHPELSEAQLTERVREAFSADA